MKVVYLLFIHLQLIPLGVLHAQNDQLDSLLQKKLIASKDTAKVNALNVLSKRYQRINPEKALAYAKEAAQLGQNINYTSGVAVAYNNLGSSNYFQNNYAQALEWHTKAVELHRSIGNIKGEGYTLNDIGLIYHKQNNYPKTLEYYLKSLRLCEQQKDEILISSSLNNIGNVHTEQENYEKALVYYFKSLEIRKKIFKNGRKVSQLLGNIGDIYLRQQQYEKALPYFLSSLDGLTEQDNDQKAISLSNIGIVYGGVKDGGLGNYPKALEYLTDALQLQEKVIDKYMMPYILMGIAYIHQHRNNLKESERYALKAVEFAKTMEIKSLMEELYLLLSDLAEKQGNYTKAYDYHKNFVETQESINKEETIRRITQLQANYEIDKKQAEIELLKKDQEQEAFVRKTLTAGFLGILIISGLIVSMQRLKIKKNKLLLEKSKEVEHKNNKLEEQAQILEQQAEELELQTEKLKELDQIKTNFFTNISHEFRTPLTIIMSGLGEKLAEFNESIQKESLPITKKDVSMMFRNSKRLLQLINQLLDLSKLESGQMRLFLKMGDFSQFIKVILASFESLASSKNIRFQYKLPAGNLKCFFDADKVETILYNLLSNAFKFTPEEGLVAFEVINEIGSDSVKIIISDNGAGIPEQELGKIFERFYQVDASTKREFEGSGIGLSLTRELVVLMNGKIDVESKIGAGTTFSFTLPVIEEPALSSIGLEDLESSYFGSPAALDDVANNENNSDLIYVSSPVNKILLVEDSDDLRAYINGILEKKYTVIQASNGEEALELAKENIPDLILSDMMMPKMDGFTLCEEIRKNELTSHIPFVLLTARATIESRLEGLELGADEYLTKPFHIKELEVRIKNLLDQRKNLRERFSKELKIKPSEVTVTSIDEKFLKKAMEIVERNIANAGFSVEIFSEEIGMSRKNLHRKMVALIDQGPNEFIRSFRLKRARHLLEQNGGNVGEIAYATGFNNLSYFTKCFKDEYGISPSEVRLASEV